MTRFLQVVAAVTGLAVTAATSQVLAERRDRRRFPPPGQLVDVSGDLGVTEQPRKGEELTALQERLAGLSTNSRRLVVQGAYHEGLISRPEFARTVAQEITSLVRAVASSGDRPHTGR